MTRAQTASFSALLVSGGLLLGACHPVRGHAVLFGHRHYTTVAARLTCPEREGELTRTSAATDGRACHYTSDDGEDVDLTLLPLNGASPAQALLPTEAALQADLPRAATAQAKAQDRAQDRTDTANDDGDDSDDDADNDGHEHRNGIHVHTDEHDHIDLPGVHIDADGDKAHVRLPGVSIDADGDKANVRAGLFGLDGAVIEADNGHAVVRAGAADDRGVDLTYILASDTAGPHGERAAGYIARGPAGGPLVLGTFRTTRSSHDDRHNRDDLSRLVNLNVR